MKYITLMLYANDFVWFEFGNNAALKVLETLFIFVKSCNRISLLSQMLATTPQVIHLALEFPVGESFQLWNSAFLNHKNCSDVLCLCSFVGFMKLFYFTKVLKCITLRRFTD